MSNYLDADGLQQERPERDARKNLMLAASIEGGAANRPVRIRNLSASGAMIDGAVLPAKGSRFMLRRLEMQIGARVVWNADGRCGITFDETIVVDEWIAGTRRLGNEQHFGQARVDQVQAALRSGAPAVAQPPAPPSVSALRRRESDSLIGQEIMLVKHMLDRISSELSEDIEVLMRHERALQNCDIASAILDLVAKVVAADDREAAIARVNMHEVKARLSGRPTLS